MNIDTASSPSIGVFDSGVGGLSVLNALRRRLPQAPLLYVGDVAHAPYGERDANDVIERCHRIVGHLAALGARVIVVACNTATVLGIDAMRRRWPTLTFVGVEPGVKPAVARTLTRRVAVMTTPATATSARLRHLIDTFAPGVHVHVQSCPGLAALIEAGVHDGSALHAVLAPLCAEVRAARVDTVVLGCTHYPFVAEPIQALLDHRHTLIDTASAVAERAAVVWGQPPVGQARLRLLSTGATATMATLLRRCRELEFARVEPASI